MMIELNKNILTVSQLIYQIKGLLEKEFPYIWLTGEISNFTLASSGHMYFVLKDEQSAIKAVMFRLNNRFLPFKPADGMEVIAFGRPSIYEPKGELQFVIESMQQKGIGALQLAFLELKERLQKEGLFDSIHKKPLPFLPKKIGIITSLKGAVIHDMITIMRRRFPRIGILIYPVNVQGEEAPPQIIVAIDRLNQFNDIDVIILARGGGSIEDLWAFNDEGVARAIFRSKIPIVSAIGHETDYTIADFVADVRAPTPSAAAEIVVPEYFSLLKNITSLNQRLKNSLLKKVEYYKLRTGPEIIQRMFSSIRDIIFRREQDLDNLNKRLVETIREKINYEKGKLADLQKKFYHFHPQVLLSRNMLKTQMLRMRLIEAFSRYLYQKKDKIARLYKSLEILDPISILKRGYSIVYSEKTGKLIVKSEDLTLDEILKILLYKGKIRGKVIEINNENFKDNLERLKNERGEL